MPEKCMLNLLNNGILRRFNPKIDTIIIAKWYPHENKETKSDIKTKRASLFYNKIC